MSLVSEPNSETKTVSSKPAGNAVGKSVDSERQWNGWFRPLAIGKRLGPFVLVPVELQSFRKKSLKRRRIIITVSGSCGNAVARNRMRRVLRPLIEAQIKECAQPDAFASSSKSQKGIWVRLVKAQRLDAGMKAEDLKSYVRKGALWFCSQQLVSSSTK